MLPKKYSKFSMLGLNSVWTETFQNTAGIRKGRGTRDQIANICWIIEKARELQKEKEKQIYFCSLTMLKPLCGSQQTVGNSSRWEYQTTWTASCQTCMQVKKQQLEPDMERWTDSKLEKVYVKAVYCHPAYLTYMQRTSCKMQGWINTSWNQDCQEKYQ